MARANNYQFGRLNLLAQYDNKKDYLISGLTAGKTVFNRNFEWGFINVEEFNDEEFGEFITGYLAKFRPVDEEVVDRARREIDIENIDDKIEAKARFFLHVDSGIIAFHSASKIGSELFKERFVRVFIEGVGYIFADADIQTISDPQRIFEAIKQFDIIRRVSLTLHPSNPHNRDLWKPVDERMKELKATSYHEEYVSDAKKSPSEGLKIEDEPDITRKIYMAEDGYGKGQVSGIEDGREKTVSTGDNPVVVPVPSSESMPKESIFDSIRHKLSEIFSRFKS